MSAPVTNVGDAVKWINAKQIECGAKGANLFKMPNLDSIPNEAIEFGVQLSEAGILFLPYKWTQFAINVGKSMKMLIDCQEVDGAVFIIAWACDLQPHKRGNLVTYVMTAFAKEGKVMLDPSAGDLTEDQALRISGILYKILGLLSSGMGKVTNVEAPVALNKKRHRTGKPPIVKHNVVEVRNDAHTIIHTHETSGVRLHWRRGHIRHLKSGVIAIVRPHLVGSRDLGIIVHDWYDARSMIAITDREFTIQ